MTLDCAIRMLLLLLLQRGELHGIVSPLLFRCPPFDKHVEPDPAWQASHRASESSDGEPMDPHAGKPPAGTPKRTSDDDRPSKELVTGPACCAQGEEGLCAPWFGARRTCSHGPT